MEDAQIIDHFFRRDPEAIRAAQEKYEKRCLAAAWPWTSATITAPPSAAAT